MSFNLSSKSCLVFRKLIDDRLENDTSNYGSFNQKTNILSQNEENVIHAASLKTDTAVSTKVVPQSVLTIPIGIMGNDSLALLG